MNTLESWTIAACAELGIDPASLNMTEVLDLTRDVAQHVARPAAPLTAYLLGVAVGGGQSAEGAASRLRQLATGWPRTRPDPDPPPGDLLSGPPTGLTGSCG